MELTPHTVGAICTVLPPQVLPEGAMNLVLFPLLCGAGRVPTGPRAAHRCEACGALLSALSAACPAIASSQGMKLLKPKH